MSMTGWAGKLAHPDREESYMLTVTKRRSRRVTERKENVTLKMREGLVDAIRAAAREESRSTSNFVLFATIQYLRDHYGYKDDNSPADSESAPGGEQQESNDDSDDDGDIGPPWSWHQGDDPEGETRDSEN